MHMVQHVLLLEVRRAAARAQPAVESPVASVLALDPPRCGRRRRAGRVGRARALGRGVARRSRLRVRADERRSSSLWHVPALYDAALAYPALHDLEHVTFFLTALLFWAHLLGEGPVPARLTLPWRAVYAVGAMVVGWALAVTIAMAPSPLYSHYVGSRSRPWGLSALADQQLAAGIMWVPGVGAVDGDRARMRVRLARSGSASPGLGTTTRRRALRSRREVQDAMTTLAGRTSRPGRC